MTRIHTTFVLTITTISLMVCAHTQGSIQIAFNGTDTDGNGFELVFEVDNGGSSIINQSWGINDLVSLTYYNDSLVGLGYDDRAYTATDLGANWLVTAHTNAAGELSIAAMIDPYHELMFEGIGQMYLLYDATILVDAGYVGTHDSNTNNGLVFGDDLTGWSILESSSTIPEPGSLAIWGLIGIAFVANSRRLRRQL